MHVLNVLSSTFLLLLASVSPSNSVSTSVSVSVGVVSSSLVTTLFVLLLQLQPQLVIAKTIENEFQLSRFNTEAVVGSFCVSPRKRGHVKFRLQTPPQPPPPPPPMKSSSEKQNEPDNTKNTKANDKNEDWNHLQLRLYRDENWTSYQTAMTCTEKADLAIQHQPVMTMENNKTLQHNNNNNNNNNEIIVHMQILNTQEHRAHYYYVVVSDCSLMGEFFMDHSNELPIMQYTMELTNNGSHLSADELHLNIMHMVTLFVSGILATLLALKVLVEFYEKSSVHAAVLWVMTAAASDSLASLLAIIHLQLYAHNGIGSPWLDSLSCHLEATCDSLVALLLLSIGAGWTLPSDVWVNLHNHNNHHNNTTTSQQQQQQSNNHRPYPYHFANNTILQKLIRGFQSPFAAFDSTFSFTSSPSALLTAFIFLSHVLLAQWGLHYHNNDFDSYHDLEHLPGKVLMVLRGLLGLCLWICCANTKLTCRYMSPSLVVFYNQLALVGTLWFESLPILTWYVNTAVAVHLRHRTIGVWGASLQMISIALLSWLVTAHTTTYHKMSHLSSTSPQDSLTERLRLSSTAPGEGFRKWIIMGKAKIRLD